MSTNLPFQKHTSKKGVTENLDQQKKFTINK